MDEGSKTFFSVSGCLLLEGKAGLLFSKKAVRMVDSFCDVFVLFMEANCYLNTAKKHTNSYGVRVILVPVEKRRFSRIISSGKPIVVRVL
jgi:hypothetical protein